MAQIKALNAVLSNLDSLSLTIESESLNYMKHSIKTVENTAKKLVPVSTGKLRNSICSQAVQTKDGVFGRVYTKSEYAAFVEFGTGQRGSASPSPPKYGGNISYSKNWAGMAAKPFLYPALKSAKPEVVDGVIDAARKVLKDRSGGKK